MVDHVQCRRHTVADSDSDRSRTVAPIDSFKGSLGAVSVKLSTLAGFFRWFAQGLAVEGEAVRGVDETVEDGIGDCRIDNHLVPVVDGLVLNEFRTPRIVKARRKLIHHPDGAICRAQKQRRELTGHNRRAAAMAIVDNFEQVAALLRGQRSQPPVVEDQKLDTSEAPEEASLPLGRRMERPLALPRSSGGFRRLIPVLCPWTFGPYVFVGSLARRDLRAGLFVYVARQMISLRP
jgi:hypothetical protein